MALGRIHSVESFGALDGPGLRYVVFLQGCPLSCAYCQNKDATLAGGRETSVDELMLEIGKCLPYLKEGGVTASGGEPLAQADFVAELFRRCREEGLDTALDSCMYAPLSALKKVLPYTSLLMASVKQMDPQMHLKLTGRRNEKILENIRLADKTTPVRLRYVVIPGLTDGQKDLGAFADFASSLARLECVELLPYNTLGREKWGKLGLKYPLGGVPAPTQAQMRKAEGALLAKKLPVLGAARALAGR